MQSGVLRALRSHAASRTPEETLRGGGKLTSGLAKRVCVAPALHLCERWTLSMEFPGRPPPTAPNLTIPNTLHHQHDAAYVSCCPTLPGRERAPPRHPGKSTAPHRNGNRPRSGTAPPRTGNSHRPRTWNSKAALPRNSHLPASPNQQQPPRHRNYSPPLYLNSTLLSH
ncbi:unnamed protein product [Arctogadus glacialis]